MNWENIVLEEIEKEKVENLPENSWSSFALRRERESKRGAMNRKGGKLKDMNFDCDLFRAFLKLLLILAPFR